jgi:hypothetical protein
MARMIFLAALVLFLAGCDGRNKEQMESDQKALTPILICEKDGVRLYKVKDATPGGPGWVYFSVPTGDAHWTTQVDDGNGGTDTIYHQTAGSNRSKGKK